MYLYLRQSDNSEAILANVKCNQVCSPRIKIYNILVARVRNVKFTTVCDSCNRVGGEVGWSCREGGGGGGGGRGHS